MRWSVGIEAEGDRVLTREEVVELADAVAAHDGIATGHRHQPLRRPADRAGRQPRRRRSSRPPREFTAAAAQAGPAARPDRPGRGDQRGRETTAASDDPARLAGRLPVRGAAAAGRLDAAGRGRGLRDLYKPDPDTKPERYAVIYVGHSDDLSAERFPFQHPRAAVLGPPRRVRWKVYICTYEVPGGGRAHREQIARELTAIYRPGCNTSSTTRPGRTSGSASTPAPDHRTRRPPATADQRADLRSATLRGGGSPPRRAAGTAAFAGRRPGRLGHGGRARAAG